MSAALPPPTPTIRTRSVVVGLVVALTAATSLIGSVPAGAATSPERQKISELEAKRSKLRADKAKKASQINALKATDTEVQQAIDGLGDEVNAQNAALADAERAQSQAEVDQAAAEAAVAQAQSDLAGLKTDMRRQAINAYVNVPSENEWSVLTAVDALTASTKDTYLSASSNRSLDSVERYRALQEDLGLAQQRATDAAARARDHRAQVNTHLNQLQASQAQQQKLADQVADRIANSEAEAASLAAIDGQLSSQLTSAQSALAAKLAAQQRAIAAARATLTRSGRKVAAAPSASPPKGGDIPARSVGSGNLATVRGITVDASIAGNLAAMLAAAEADGVSISGAGYRDPAGQIAVRRNNCGSSNFAIYEAPSSSCRPPTARPGQSMHERGLAIDFTSGGSVLNRGSAAFAWLKANAARFGFSNLPSEAWHWSTNGN